MREREADTNEIRMKIEDAQDNAVIFGSGDHNAEKIREAFGSDIVQRGDELIIRGGDTEKAKSAVLDFLWILDRQEDLDAQKTEYVLELNKEGQTYRKSNVKSDIICFTHRGRPIRAKTLGQIAYADNIRHNDIVFGIGPAGTGKTYLAVAMAVHAFKNKEVEKIILARPAVEAGESLGFLPGDLQEKVDPYLRPLYDALFDILVPLAYMRGRTLDNSFIILDEAQNTTREQMKMFLTRLGFGSKAVVTGDITQIDLPKKKSSGLREAERILQDVKGISFSYLRQNDVVRHPLVRRIIDAYDRYYEETEE